MTRPDTLYALQMRTIPAEEFEVECLELLDEIRVTREVLVITKSGKPYIKATPVEEAGSLRDTVEYLVAPEELIAPIDEPWDAETA